MPKATPISRTPAPSATKSAARPATAGAAALPSMVDLARRLALLEVENDRQDALAMTAAGTAALTVRRTMDFIDAQSSAVRELILTMAPRTIADAAVLTASAWYVADDLAGSTLTVDEVFALAEKVRLALLAILPILADAADLDPDAMGWRTLVDNEAMRATEREFAA